MYHLYHMVRAMVQVVQVLPFTRKTPYFYI